MPRLALAPRRIIVEEALQTATKTRRHRRSGRPTAVARLWNAKERVDSGRILLMPQSAIRAVHKNEAEQGWKKLVSEDVAKFIEDARLLPHERGQCVEDPNRYFSFPNNVPTALRKQVYFPRFNIVLRRTTNLPPKYAAFDVPLWFNKLDMKDYLRSAYGVEVLHVRSTVMQAKIKRRDTFSPFSNGQIYRPQSKKKMTVELAEAFVWPEAEEDLSPWETDTYYKGTEAGIEANRNRSETVATEPNKSHRKSIAQQAKELLAGKTAWKPTWELLPTDSKVLKPYNPKKLDRIADATT